MKSLILSTLLLFSACSGLGHKREPAHAYSSLPEYVQMEFFETGISSNGRAYNLNAYVFLDQPEELEIVELFIDGRAYQELDLKFSESKELHTIEHQISFILHVHNTTIRFSFKDGSKVDIPLICTEAGRCFK